MLSRSTMENGTVTSWAGRSSMRAKRASTAAPTASTFLFTEVVGPGLAEQIVDAWLDAEFEGGRHARRVAMLAQIEER